MTGRPVQFELTDDVRASLLGWLERRGGTTGEFVFPSRVDRSHHMSTRQYARLVDEWVTAICLRRADYGTHPLRRTKAATIYRATGNIRAIQILRGHTKTEKTTSMPNMRCSSPGGLKSDIEAAAPRAQCGRFQALRGASSKAAVGGRQTFKQA
jgi:site-specific recombinase XerC